MRALKLWADVLKHKNLGLIQSMQNWCVPDLFLLGLRDLVPFHPAPECPCSKDIVEALAGDSWVRASSELLHVGRSCIGTGFKISSCSRLIRNISFGDRILIDRTQLTNSLQRTRACEQFNSWLQGGFFQSSYISYRMVLDLSKDSK